LSLRAYLPVGQAQNKVDIPQSARVDDSKDDKFFSQLKKLPPALVLRYVREQLLRDQSNNQAILTHRCNPLFPKANVTVSQTQNRVIFSEPDLMDDDDDWLGIKDLPDFNEQKIASAIPAPEVNAAKIQAETPEAKKENNIKKKLQKSKPKVEIAECTIDPNKHYVGEKELSKRVKISVSKLQKDRHMGKGFAYVKYGRRVLYCVEDILEIMRSRTIHPNN
jgi:hypothetical protein